MAAAAASNGTRYDRQLRLWGDHGQRDLEQAKLCLINGGSLGTEILKNLVLPGVGSFVVVDSAKVTEADLGKNFFVDAPSVGQSRARRTAELLNELNENVKGDYLEEEFSAILESNPSFFLSFSLVVAVGLSLESALPLANVLWGKVPLVLARGYGMVGTFRIVAKEHYVVEAHPDNFIPDLRALTPFPALAALADACNLESLSDEQHAHVPYLILIIKELDKWRAAHGGSVPSNRKDKDAFKTQLRAGMRELEGQDREVNFSEAVDASNVALVPQQIDGPLQAIFADERCHITDDKSTPFWVVVRALREFHERHHLLPLSGALPDMTADSVSYAALHSAFATKAKEDLMEVSARVAELQSALPSPVNEEYIKLLCKNCAWLQLLSGTSLPEELANPPSVRSLVESSLDNPASNAVWYVLFRAADRFYASHRHFPDEQRAEADHGEFKAEVHALLGDMGLGPTLQDEYMQEFCRFGAAELHNVSAFLGGVIAQEVIKLLTGQYVPVNNLAIFSAITGGVETFQI